MESFLCRLGRCWHPEKSKDNLGSQSQDRRLGTAECEHMVPPSFSEPMWFSVPCLPSLCLGHSGAGEDISHHLVFSYSVPDSLAPDSLSWLRISALGRSQILWVPSECDLAENSHLDGRPTLTSLSASRLDALILGPSLCWDPFLP